MENYQRSKYRFHKVALYLQKQYAVTPDDHRNRDREVEELVKFVLKQKLLFYCKNWSKLDKSKREFTFTFPKMHQ